MIKVNVEQGSDEWFAARLGIPTASEFASIIQPSTLKPSTSLLTYLHKLLAENASGKPNDGFYNDWMKRGHELESDARESYSFINDVEVEEIGFIYKDKDKLIGCSPDGIMEEKKKKGLEIKCPSEGVHIGYLLGQKLPTKYIAQVQGSMNVTGYPEWDFMSYHPDFPSLIVTVKRDPEFQAALNAQLELFIKTMLKQRKLLDFILKR